MPLHRQSLEIVLRLERETSPGVALERYQLAADLIAGGAPADRAEARTLLDTSITTLKGQTPPHPPLAEIVAERGRLGPAR